jgi:hypothetical protein
VQHLRSRFSYHVDNQSAQYIAPVIAVDTDLARDQDWEGRMIRWMKRQDRLGKLCCNNTADDHRGNWPGTADMFIYVVACRLAD